MHISNDERTQAMASTVIPSSSPTTIPKSSIQTSFLPQTSQLSIFKKKKPCYFVPNKVVSCKATKGNRNQPTSGGSSLNRIDRRDVLIGLGGLYGATNLANDPFAILATPIPAPDLTNCKEVTIKNKTEGTSMTVDCCPPKDAKVTDFKPPQFSKIRCRPAAHLVDSDYIAKFTEAMRRMKALPANDPRSFMQQANVHCAYCDGAYEQVGFPDQVIQVHHSWLFFPFHRLYLYFFERILGKLIDDPDFAMPFWNWDAPAGMTIPAIYVNHSSPLYDEKRNVHHQPPELVDLDYNGHDEETTGEDKKKRRNLCLMYRQMVYPNKPCLFLGHPYCLGSPPNPGMGSIESCPHNNVHDWCGDKRQPNSEDMGILYSAGRDPVFYSHHGNVDRLWSIWKSSLGEKRSDFTCTDWLDASFVFYDENTNLVRAKVRDCLDTKTLGYDYQSVDIPWLKVKPIPRFAKKEKRNQDRAMEAETKIPNDGIVLDQKRSFKIPREKKSRSRLEKEKEEEVLVLQNIQLDRDARVKFDVYINDEDDEKHTGPEYSEFVGCFSNLPHSHGHGEKMETNLTLAISNLLEDLDSDGDDNIVVTLVPKIGKGLVTVGNIKIDFIRE